MKNKKIAHRRIWAIILAGCLLLFLASCGSSVESPNESTRPNTSSSPNESNSPRPPPGSERDNAAEKGQERHLEETAKQCDGKVPSHQPFGTHRDGKIALICRHHLAHRSHDGTFAVILPPPFRGIKYDAAFSP